MECPPELEFDALVQSFHSLLEDTTSDAIRRALFREFCVVQDMPDDQARKAVDKCVRLIGRCLANTDSKTFALLQDDDVLYPVVQLMFATYKFGTAPPHYKLAYAIYVAAWSYELGCKVFNDKQWGGCALNAMWEAYMTSNKKMNKRMCGSIEGIAQRSGGFEKLGSMPCFPGPAPPAYKDWCGYFKKIPQQIAHPLVRAFGMTSRSSITNVTFCYINALDDSQVHRKPRKSWLHPPLSQCKRTVPKTPPPTPPPTPTPTPPPSEDEKPHVRFTERRRRNLQELVRD